MTTLRVAILAFASLAVLLPCVGVAQTQDAFPSRPVTIVMPYAAGGSADVLVRILGERMRLSLGQPVVIENVTGAAGSIGTGRVARAAPDGYTLGLGNWSTHVANAAVYALPYDTVSDFQPIALVATTPLLIATRRDFPAADLKSLIAWLQRNPDKASQATNGAGSVMHLAGVLFQKQTGTRFAFVPYRGAGPAMNDMLGGTVDLYFGLPADILPHARNNKVKVLAVMSGQPIAAAPDIPPVDEAGVAGLHVSAWFGLWGPAGMPTEPVRAINAAVRAALSDPEVRRKLTTELTLDIPSPAQQTPEALRVFQAEEIARWRPVIKDANIRHE